MKLNNIKAYWVKMLPFKDINDIPNLPTVDVQWFQNRLISLGAIPKDKLEDGKYYLGRCRNAKVAQWNANKEGQFKNKGVFTHMRTKFYSVYPEDINHFQDDNGYYDVFIPIKEVEPDEYQKIKQAHEIKK